MLGKGYARVVEHASLVVRGTLARGLGAALLNAWYARTTEKLYPHTVWFATLSALRRHGVLHRQSAVHAAYRGHAGRGPCVLPLEPTQGGRDAPCGSPGALQCRGGDAGARAV